MKQQHNVFWIASAPTAVFLVIAAVAMASTATIPHTFVPGNVADANEVNANFAAMKNAVDDNHGRISAIETGAPVVGLDADRLDGLHASTLVRASSEQAMTNVDNLNSTTWATYLTKTVNAPTAGILLLWVDMMAQRDIDSAVGTYGRLHVQVTVDGTPAGPSSQADYYDSATSGSASVSLARAVPVAAGGRVVRVQLKETGLGMVYVYDRTLTTLFVPFGNTGTQGALKPEVRQP